MDLAAATNEKPSFQVWLTREVTESVSIEVFGGDREGAVKAALETVEKGDVGWERDEFPVVTEPRVSDVVRVVGP